MAFGISQSVRSREMQVCTPELFHQATKSSRVKDVCAQIAGRTHQNAFASKSFDR